MIHQAAPSPTRHARIFELLQQADRGETQQARMAIIANRSLDEETAGKIISHAVGSLKPEARTGRIGAAGVSPPWIGWLPS